MNQIGRLAERDQALLAVYVPEIERRGGETEIWEGHRRKNLRPLPLRVSDSKDDLVLLRVEGWRFYSARVQSRLATLAYLCGSDDCGPWAVRVPGSCQSVAAALAWITPAEVRRATSAGRLIGRQGDIYVLRARRDSGLERLPANHRLVTLADARDWWRLSGTDRALVHRPDDPGGARRHRALSCSGPVRIVRQRVYRMGRSGRRSGGD